MSQDFCIAPTRSTCHVGWVPHSPLLGHCRIEKCGVDSNFAPMSKIALFSYTRPRSQFDALAVSTTEDWHRAMDEACVRPLHPGYGLWLVEHQIWPWEEDMPVLFDLTSIAEDSARGRLFVRRDRSGQVHCGLHSVMYPRTRELASAVELI